MNFINHQSTGAAGLRIAATIFIILGWLSLIVNFFVGVSDDKEFWLFLICGIASVGVGYLTACILRALASVAEAAQVYFNQVAAAEE